MQERAQHRALRLGGILFKTAALNSLYTCDAHCYKSFMFCALELGAVLVDLHLPLHLLQQVVELRAHNAVVTCCNMRSHL